MEGKEDWGYLCPFSQNSPNVIISSQKYPEWNSVNPNDAIKFYDDWNLHEFNFIQFSFNFSCSFSVSKSIPGAYSLNWGCSPPLWRHRASVRFQINICGSKIAQCLLVHQKWFISWWCLSDSRLKTLKKSSTLHRSSAICISLYWLLIEIDCRWPQFNKLTRAAKSKRK